MHYACSRCSLYDSEIRRLDALRGTSKLDFRQLFLVKESLALMFQMMQLPVEALYQYEELEELITFAPAESLPESTWPFCPVEKVNQHGKKTRKSLRGSSTVSENSSPDSNNKTSVTSNDNEEVSKVDTDNVPQWMCACQQGLAVLRYSINHSRMRVLKNQMSLLELQQYVFARTCFFLFSLSRPAHCAEKAVKFLTHVRGEIQTKFDALDEEEQFGVGGDIYSSRHSISMEQLSVVMLDGKEEKDSKGGLENLNGLETSVQRSNMADLWLIVSTVQIVKKCRESILSCSDTVPTAELQSPSSDEASTLPSNSRKITESTDISVTASSTDPKNSSISSLFNDETLGIMGKILSRQLIELLHIAKNKLFNLIQKGHKYRLTSLEMASSFIEWDDFDTVKDRFPVLCEQNVQNLEDKLCCQSNTCLDEVC